MSGTLSFPKLNGTNYHAWSDNMKAALQARLLWLIVTGRRSQPTEPDPNPPVNANQKLFTPSSTEYKDWNQSHNDFLSWLESDNAAMGLMRGAMEFSQREHVANVSTSREMWDRLHKLHITQRQAVNIHYYYQDLYAKKWDKRTIMSDHISYFLNLHHHIIEAGEKLDDIHVVHAILLSLPHSSIWDVIKQNLLDKGKALTLDMVSAELISVHDCNEHDQVVEETEKKAKAEQLALFAKTTGSSGNSAKKNKKGKSVDKSKKPKVQPPRTQCNTCGQERHWSPEYPNKSTKGKDGVP